MNDLAFNAGKLLADEKLMEVAAREFCHRMGADPDDKINMPSKIATRESARANAPMFGLQMVPRWEVTAREQIRPFCIMLMVIGGASGPEPRG